jgi:hypothetical protein
MALIFGLAGRRFVRCEARNALIYVARFAQLHSGTAIGRGVGVPQFDGAAPVVSGQLPI